jgi:hypothetical protein
MTSYHGADTAKVQNDMRRQAKRKQSRGTGNRPQQEIIDPREAREYVPRHFQGTIDPTLFNDIMFWASSEGLMVTNGIFRRWFMNDMKLTDNDTKPKDLIVTLHGQNAAIMNGIGARVKITKTGFIMEDGTQPPVTIWSITFNLIKTELFGIQAKWDNTRNQMMLY